MKKLLCLAAVLLAGCTTFKSVQVKHPDGTLESKQTVRSFWDSKSDLAKLRATQAEHGTNLAQGLSLAGLEQESSGTNAVELLRAVGDILKNLPVK